MTACSLHTLPDYSLPTMTACSLLFGSWHLLVISLSFKRTKCLLFYTMHSQQTQLVNQTSSESMPYLILEENKWREGQKRTIPHKEAEQIYNTIKLLSLDQTIKWWQHTESRRFKYSTNYKITELKKGYSVRSRWKLNIYKNNEENVNII